MASTLPQNAFFNALVNHDAQTIAVVEKASDRKFTFGRLVRDVTLGRAWLDRTMGNMHLNSECVAFMAENSYEYVGAREL